MAELSFENLEFKETNNKIRVSFLKLFYFDLAKEDLPDSNFIVGKNKIIFKSISQEKAERKFNNLLLKGFENLRNKLNNKKTIYIHKNSGIPLIGNLEFGLVDRNTNIIEVRPITSCNLNCIFCSVDQDKRLIDFVVEKDYLVEEFKKLVEFKQCSNIEAHFGTQGEPLLYEPLADLVKDIRKIKQVKKFSINTNATLLTKNKANELIKAGINQFNISINAMNQETAGKMAGCSYNINKVLEIAEYISSKTSIRISPVWLQGYNDKEMDKIIEFAKKIKAKLGIQNFLNYRFGKNPQKQMKFEIFYKKLKELEKKHNIKLILSEKDFSIEKTRPLPKPFKKGQTIKANIIIPGRLRGEMIAVAEDRTITIPDCSKKGSVSVRIIRDKHNIFVGLVK